MTRPPEITKKLKTIDSEITLYIKELEKENFRLQSVIAKQQVKLTSIGNQIKALKKISDNPKGNIIIKSYND